MQSMLVSVEQRVRKEREKEEGKERGRMPVTSLGSWVGSGPEEPQMPYSPGAWLWSHEPQRIVLSRGTA